MRMLDAERDHSVKALQLCLSKGETEYFVQCLNELLADPEKNDHRHVLGDECDRDLSFSIITPAKLAEGGYTKLEMEILTER